MGARSWLSVGCGLAVAAPAAFLGAAVVPGAGHGVRVRVGGQRAAAALFGAAVVARAGRALDRVSVEGRRCRALRERGGSLFGSAVVAGVGRLGRGDGAAAFLGAAGVAGVVGRAGRA